MGHRREHRDGLRDEVRQPRGLHRRPAAAREIEQLTDERGHLPGLLGDDACALGDVIRGVVATGQKACVVEYYVERRAEFAREPGGHLTDGSKPVGVTHLLNRAEPRLVVRLGFVIGLAQTLAHRVELHRKLGDFIVLLQSQRAGEVADADPLCPRAKSAHGLTDEVCAVQRRDLRAHNHGDDADEVAADERCCGWSDSLTSMTGSVPVEPRGAQRAADEVVVAPGVFAKHRSLAVDAKPGVDHGDGEHHRQDAEDELAGDLHPIVGAIGRFPGAPSGRG